MAKYAIGLIKICFSFQKLPEAQRKDSSGVNNSEIRQSQLNEVIDREGQHVEDFPNQDTYGY